MKKTLRLLSLAVLTIGLLGSCAKIDERISNLEKRVDGIEATSIASVQQQIDGIKTSINDLKAADAAINGKIDELKTTAETHQTLIDALKEADQALGQKDAALEERIATLEGQVAVIAGQIVSLEDADKAINVRIDELKSYVDTEIGKAKDWAEETFATLDQYEQTADDLAALSVTVTGISTTLAGVQTSISGLDTKIDGISTELQGKITSAKTELEGKITSLKTELEGKIATAISNSETSIKSWINELLEGYYTAAQVEEKIGALNTAIEGAKGTAKERIDSVAKELTTLKTAVDTAKAAIRVEYKNAINVAINKLDGEIRGALLDSIAAVNGRAEALDTRVTDLESRMLAVEGNVNKLLAMIQSVSITPAYSDGSVEAVDGILTLKCIVRPAEALAGMQSLKDSLLIYADLVKVKTKAASAYTEIKVSEATVTDAKQGAITLKADISNYLPKGEDKALTVALKIKNGISDFITEFVPVYVAPAPVAPEGALSGVFSVGTGKKIFFSKGNLYYDGSKFNFEANQYEIQFSWDASHVSHFFWSKNESVAYAASYSESGTSASDVFFTNETETTAKSDFTVNGVTGKYRTLSKGEWTYLFNTRTMANGGARYENLTSSGITIQNVIFKGVVLFPDDFTEQTTWKTKYTTWEALNNAGLVFLPVGGYRFEGIRQVGKNGLYWYSSANGNDVADRVYFDDSSVSLSSASLRDLGLSVRLVTEGVSPKPVVPVTGVTLNKTELSLIAGKSETLVATVQPEDATNKNVIWSSDNTGVATVGSTDGKVTAVAEGTATITAIVDGLFTATCEVVVVRSKGEGTEASPYLLYEAEDLLKLRELCKEISDDSSVEKADAATPTYFKMMEDIDLTGVDWTPYNYNSNYLRKIDFNGNHKTISNLTCDKEGVYASLFGVLFGTVYDLNVKNAYVKSNQTAGIMCGYLGVGNKKGHIHNCSVQGKVETNNSPTGGLCGQNGVGGDIYECLVDVDVVETANKNYVGGIVGYEKVTGCVIHDCIVKGSVTGFMKDDGSGTQRVGGIMGMLYKENSSVINCITLNTLKGARCIGGIVGHANVDKWDERHPNNTIKGCIAWNPEIISTQIAEDGASNGAIVGFGSEYNTYVDCVRKPDMKYTYPDPGFAEGDNNPDGKFNTFFNQENSSDTTPLQGVIHDNSAKLYRSPYNGKAATAGETASQVAKRLGWDETIWDLSGDIPSLKRVYAE